jgi:hypothetical protein
VLRILTGLEDDLHWNALNDLDEVAGRILGRQKAEARTGRARQAVDLALEFTAAERVDVDRRGWPGRMYFSCVSLKFAVTQTSSIWTSARSGWPGCTT